MEAATQPQAHMLNQVGNFIRRYLVGSGQQAVLLTESGIPPYSLYDSLPARTLWPLVGSLHVSAFRNLFRRCFGVVSAFFCEIVNKNAVCFGVSALGVSLVEA